MISNNISSHSENLLIEIVNNLNSISRKFECRCDAHFFYFCDKKNYSTLFACASILNKNYQLISSLGKHRDVEIYPEFNTEKYAVLESVVDLFNDLPDFKNADTRTAVFRINSNKTYKVDFAINEPNALSLQIFHIGQPNSYFKLGDIELTQDQTDFIRDYNAVRAASNDEEDEDDDSGHA